MRLSYWICVGVLIVQLGGGSPLRGEDKDVLLLVANKGALAALDPALQLRLEWQHDDYVTVDQADLYDAAGLDALARQHDMVLISESLGSGSVLQDGAFKLKDTPVPIISYEAYMWDDAFWTEVPQFDKFGNTGRTDLIDSALDAGLDAAQTDLYITAAGASHPLGAGFSAGPLTIHTEPYSVNFGTPSADATVIATADAAGNFPSHFVYNTGDKLVNGSVVPATRIAAFIGQAANPNANFPPRIDLYNENGVALMDAMFEYTLGPKPAVPLPLPPIKVAGKNLGPLSIDGDLANIVLGPPVNTPGLSQYWYEGNMTNNPEAFLAAGDDGSAANPLVNPSGGPFVSDTTWWNGSQGQPVSDLVLPDYPAGLAGTRFAGSTNADNYGVRLTGEVFIPSNGEMLFRDGIDDYTMVAIDVDGNGVLDGVSDLTNGDVGFLFSDVVIHDNDWANIDGSDQIADIGYANFTNIDTGGEWRKIEIWMSEGGGGDGGILYAGSLKDPDIWDDRDPNALTQDQRDKFVLRPDQIRTQIESILSGEANAKLRDDVTYVVQVGNGDGDRIVVNDRAGVLTTSLDLAGATIRVKALDGLAEGTSWMLFDADSITGADTVNWLFDDPALWDLSQIGSGIIRFGASSTGDCNGDGMITIADANCTSADALDAFLSANGFLAGDADGDHVVQFPDFVILANNFGKTGQYTEGDFDKDGTVQFPDFVILANNFGKMGAVAAAVPEPAAGLMIVLGWCGCWAATRRRNSTAR